MFINEFMASNDTTITDPLYNLSGDWIEIYNADPLTIDLKDYHLTDDPTDPAKWKIENQILVESGSHTLIWADGFDRDYHTNFKLARGGEFIGLYSPDLKIIDSLTYPVQETDISYGRFPDGGTSWFYFDHASPEVSNGNDGFSNLASPAKFSMPSGKYESTINVTLSSDTDSAEIYYTKDGSIPDTNSFRYQDPIHIRYSTSLRAVVYRDGYLPSSVITKSYLMFVKTDLPIVAISTNPDNFFDDQIGIYVAGTNGISGYCTSELRNWNQDWERPVHVDFFDENGLHLIDQDAGIKIAGGCSRLYPQKSLEIVARNIYGDDRFHHRMFKDKPILEFKSFILRSGAQDWWRSMIRDGFLHTLVCQTMNLDYQAYRPAVVYLNGKYWGIHNIREKLNQYYMESNLGLDPENLDIIKISKYGYAQEGDIESYTEMMNYVAENDLSQEKNYAYISSVIDIENYINYQIYEIYIANRDWPGNNLKLFRERTAGSKWRWLLYDLDMGFSGNGESRYYSNTLEQATEENGPSWPNPPWSTLLFRRLLENKQFREEFVQRFAIYLSSSFESEYVLSVMDSIRQQVASEIPRHKERWPKSLSYADSWQELLDLIIEFAHLRPEYMIDHLQTKFNLADQVTVKIQSNISNAGLLIANMVKMRQISNTLNVFPDMPLSLKVQALPGYRFLYWETTGQIFDDKIEIVPDNPMTITLVFTKDTLQSSPIVINEVNPNSSTLFDPGDWIELYNNTEDIIDLSGWSFQDSQDTSSFIVPAGTELAGDAYLVLCRDTIRFKEHFPYVTNYIGNFTFGLNSSGESIHISNDNGDMIDSLHYGDTVPWPESSNGKTLALKHPRLDNSLGVNWKSSEMYGTPGELNDAFLEIKRDKPDVVVNTFELEQNYPNPFNSQTVVRFNIPNAGSVRFAIYDTRGRQVFSSTNSYFQPGGYEISWKADPNLASGVYFYSIQFSRKILSRKFIYLK